MNNKNSNSKTSTFVIIIIVVLALVAVAFMVARKPVNKLGPVTGDDNVDTEVHESDDGFPSVYYSYAGKVENINQKAIVISATKDKNDYLKKDMVVTGLVSDDTIATKITIPERINVEETGVAGTYFKRENIALSDIYPGDIVTLIAGENIKYKTSFDVIKIEVTNR